HQAAPRGMPPATRARRLAAQRAPRGRGNESLPGAGRRGRRVERDRRRPVLREPAGIPAALDRPVWRGGAARRRADGRAWRVASRHADRAAQRGARIPADGGDGRLHRGAEKATRAGALERARRAIVPGGGEPRIPAAALPRRARRGRGLRGRVPNLRRALRADGEPHYREDPFYEVLILLRDVPVEDWIRYAVHQRPGRRSGAADIASIRGKRGLELIEGAGCRGAQPRVFLERDLTAEHEPKALRVLQREAHVRFAHAAPGLATHGLTQHFEALRGKRREQ